MVFERLKSVLRSLVTGPPPVWYDPAYRLPVATIEQRVGIEPRRADLAVWYLLHHKVIGRSELRSPERIGYEALARVHTPRLLESLHDPSKLASIFGVDPTDVPVDEVMSSIRLACGGTLAAAREALERRGPTFNVLGGFHHASPDKAAGLCPANDMAVAIAQLRSEGLRGKVVVLDLDAHPPDGTADCLRDDDESWVGSLSGSDWGDLGDEIDETVLPTGCSDARYLSELDALLRRMPTPELAFVIAGGDVIAGDRLGMLGLTLDGVRARDLRIANALEGRPSVWLPGGGYNPHSWKVIAGTVVAVATGSRDPLAEVDPMTERFASVAATIQPDMLKGPLLTAEDLVDGLGVAARGRARLLGYYAPSGIEYAFFRLGILTHLRRLGYGRFRVDIDHTDFGDRVRLFGHADEHEHLLIECVLEKRIIRADPMLFVHWLTLRHPRVGFTRLRPRLPGQETPGLGLAREAGEMLGLIARRLNLKGVAWRPAWFHTAYANRRDFRFVDSRREGRFQAMVRDLADYSLLEVTTAVSDGRVLMNGEVYTWEPELMAVWLGECPLDEDQIAEEREGTRFEIVPRTPKGDG